MKTLFLTAAIVLAATPTATGQTVESLKKEVWDIQAQYADSDVRISDERDARCPGQRNLSGCKIDYNATRTIATRVRARIDRTLSYLDDGNVVTAYAMFQSALESASELKTKMGVVRAKYPVTP